MNILTVATQSEGYYELLRQSAKQWGYNLQTLGWQQPWKGLAWKLDLYAEALAQLPQDAPVICADGFDVVVIAHAEEFAKGYAAFGNRILVSGQRYFPRNRWMRKMSDRIMSNHRTHTIHARVEQADSPYSRPCTGLMAGPAGAVLQLFNELIEVEAREAVGNDQILMNMHYLRQPDAIELDTRCALFQNLWRTRGFLHGKLHPKDKRAEVAVVPGSQNGAMRVQNKQFGTLPCFLHAPFNLDMGPLLKELGMQAPTVGLKKSWHYWQYSMRYYIGRTYKLYRPRFLP